MTTEMVTFKIDKKVLREIDRISKEAGFHSRTEFIRSSMRQTIEDIKLKKSLEEIAKLKGAAKKKTSKKEYERIRSMVFKESEQDFI